MNEKQSTTLFDEVKFRACIPAEMLKERRWVRYFLKPKPETGTAKIPLGNHSDESTWSSFDEAVAALEHEQGIGYCFFGGEIHGLDIDHCRNPKSGEICKEAMVLVSRLGSWAEYSVSGAGLHVFFKGSVRGKQLTESCLQYWNPKTCPRFFALTCDMVGEAFKTLKDVGEEFNYIFATARHISAKIREELMGVDPEQWAALPAERKQPAEVNHEKSKTKTRKLHKDFNLEDFLKFYSLPVDNVAKNNLGTCYRLCSCPIKGEPHVGQNSTSTNFILSSDEGLGFHCQSTGCVEWSVTQVIEHLAKTKGEYPNPIYEAKQQEESRVGCVQSLDEIEQEHREWLWPGYLGLNKVAHFGGASSEGKSPVTLDLAARVSAGLTWPDGAANNLGPRSVIILAAEDDWADTIKPRLVLAGADPRKIFRFFVTQKTVEITPSIDSDLQRLEEQIRQVGDVALIVIDPITNYLGSKEMNAEAEIRGGILMPLATVAKVRDCCIITVGHLNKRGSEAALLQRLMGAAAFGGVARDVYLFGADPDEDDKYAHVMSEIRNKSAPKLKYSTEAAKVAWGGRESEVLRVKWCGVSNADTDEVVNSPKQQDKTTSKEVQVFIKAFLRDGAKPTRMLEAALKDSGINCQDWQKPARRVAKSRQIKGQGKNAGWEWYLSTPEQATFDSNQEERVAA